MDDDDEFTRETVPPPPPTDPPRARPPPRNITIVRHVERDCDALARIAECTVTDERDVVRLLEIGTYRGETLEWCEGKSLHGVGVEMQAEARALFGRLAERWARAPVAANELREWFAIEHARLKELHMVIELRGLVLGGDRIEGVKRLRPNLPDRVLLAEWDGELAREAAPSRARAPEAGRLPRPLPCDASPGG